jgi:hypothetical protein
MTVKSKRLPRFKVNRRGADGLVRAVPPILLDLGSELEEVQRHENLAAKYGESRTKLVALSTALEAAKRHDLAEERAAAETGRKRKPSKAEKVEEQIEEQRREVEVLSQLVEESARQLLAAVVPLLPAAAEQTEQATEAALVAAHDALVAAQAHFEAANTAATERAWVATLLAEGEAHPWSSAPRATPAPRAMAAVGAALAALADDRQRAVEARAHTAAERAAESRLKVPPGARVWRVGEPDAVVTETGELVEVEEVER